MVLGEEEGMEGNLSAGSSQRAPLALRVRREENPLGATLAISNVLSGTRVLPRECRKVEGVRRTEALCRRHRLFRLRGDDGG